jgi:hypothetical protein
MRPSGPETIGAIPHSKSASARAGSEYGPDWNRPRLPWTNCSREKSPLTFVSAADGATVCSLTRSTRYWKASTPSGVSKSKASVSGSWNCAPFWARKSM